MTASSSITQTQLLTLYDVSRKINSQLNLEKLLDDIMDEAVALLKAQKGLIVFRDDQSGVLDAKVARSMDKHNINDALAISHTVIEKVEKEGRPVLLQKVPDIPGGEATKSMMMFKLKSIICVPLRTREHLIGSIYLDTTDNERFFNETDLAFLEAFANLAGIAIENARHYRQIQNWNANLEKKVEQRTRELQHKNRELLKAYEDLRNTQLQLIRSEKMASLGNLVAGIAHEINTPLGSLTSNMDLFHRSFEAIERGLAGGDAADLQKAHKASQLLSDLIHTSKSACGRISHIVRALRNFARLDEEAFKPVDIHEGLESTLILMENQYRDRISIIKDYAELPPLRCQAAQLNQVFMNLLKNACEAIPARGSIHIRTFREEDQLVVRISDDGRGIPQEHLSKIFDPGFTTKGVRVGIGLGLSISYKIVEDHGGTLHIDSEADQGTTVTAKLPLR